MRTILNLCTCLLLGIAIGLAARPDTPAAAHTLAQLATATARPATATPTTPGAQGGTATPATTATPTITPTITPTTAACLYLPLARSAP